MQHYDMSASIKREVEFCLDSGDVVGFFAFCIQFDKELDRHVATIIDPGVSRGIILPSGIKEQIRDVSEKVCEFINSLNN